MLARLVRGFPQFYLQLYQSWQVFLYISRENNFVEESLDFLLIFNEGFWIIIKFQIKGDDYQKVIILE